MSDAMQQLLLGVGGFILGSLILIGFWTFRFQRSKRRLDRRYAAEDAAETEAHRIWTEAALADLDRLSASFSDPPPDEEIR